MSLGDMISERKNGMISELIDFQSITFKNYVGNEYVFTVVFIDFTVEMTIDISLNVVTSYVLIDGTLPVDSNDLLYYLNTIVGIETLAKALDTKTADFMTIMQNINNNVAKFSELITDNSSSINNVSLNIDKVIAVGNEIMSTDNIEAVGIDLLLGEMSEIRKVNLLKEATEYAISLKPKIDSAIALEPKIDSTIVLEPKIDSAIALESKIDFVISKETLLDDFNLITPEKFEDAVTLLGNSSFQNVASTLNEIVALIPHLQKIIDLHLNLGTLIEVDGLSDELEAIVPYLSNISTVANAEIDWSTLGANLTKLVNISNNLTAILGIEQYMQYVSDVYDIKSQVITVAGMKSMIEFIANSGANLEYIVDNIDYVMEVQNNISHILAIKDYISNIVTVSNNITTINSVAANISAVAAVGNRIITNGSLCPTIVDTEISDGTTYSSIKIEELNSNQQSSIDGLIASVLALNTANAKCQFGGDTTIALSNTEQVLPFGVITQSTDTTAFEIGNSVCTIKEAGTYSFISTVVFEDSGANGSVGTVTFNLRDTTTNEVYYTQSTTVEIGDYNRDTIPFNSLMVIPDTITLPITIDINVSCNITGYSIVGFNSILSQSGGSVQTIHTINSALGNLITEELI